MEIVIGVLIGVALGTAGGLLKYVLLWRPVIKGAAKDLQKKVATAQIGGMLLNVAVLIGAYFLSERLPYSQVGLLMAAAVSLSLTGRLTTFRGLKKMPPPEAPAAAARPEKVTDNQLDMDEA